MYGSTDVISFAEGLRVIGISRATAYRLMDDPTSDFLRPFKVGGKLQYLRADIEAWLRSKATAAQPGELRRATSAFRSLWGKTNLRALDSDLYNPALRKAPEANPARSDG